MQANVITAILNLGKEKKQAQSKSPLGHRVKNLAALVGIAAGIAHPAPVQARDIYTFHAPPAPVFRKTKSEDYWLSPDANGVTPAHILAATGHIQQLPADLKNNEVLLGIKNNEGLSIADYALANGWISTLPKQTIDALHLEKETKKTGQKHSFWLEIKHEYEMKQTEERAEINQAPYHHVSEVTYMPWDEAQILNQIGSAIEAKQPCFLLDIGKGKVLAEGPREQIITDLIPKQEQELAKEKRSPYSLVLLSEQDMSHKEIEACRTNDAAAMKLYDHSLSQHPTLEELEARFPKVNPAFLQSCYENWEYTFVDMLKGCNAYPEQDINLESSQTNQIKGRER